MHIVNKILFFLWETVHIFKNASIFFLLVELRLFFFYKWYIYLRQTIIFLFHMQDVRFWKGKGWTRCMGNGGFNNSKRWSLANLDQFQGGEQLWGKWDIHRGLPWQQPVEPWLQLSAYGGHPSQLQGKNLIINLLPWIACSPHSFVFFNIHGETHENNLNNNWMFHF